MRSKFVAMNYLDEGGNPEGGVAFGQGFCISWQRGPLGRGAGRKPANGAFVEDIIAAALNRLQFYQTSKFACHENAMAIAALEGALGYLDHRTREREAREVEGTHAI